jgi:hypothetical protein
VFTTPHKDEARFDIPQPRCFFTPGNESLPPNPHAGRPPHHNSLFNIRVLFAKFVDSLYYSEPELCGGAVTVSFFEVPSLASDVLLTILHPLLESVLQTVDHLEISCLGVPFS